MRLATIVIVVAVSFVVAGCSAHGPAPPDATAARRAVQATASTVSMVGRIDGLSCRTGTPTYSTTTCTGSPAECGSTPDVTWIVERNGHGALIVGPPETDAYCIVNTRPGHG
jgi:hypothetical protein